jgi:hypothetical protein
MKLLALLFAVVLTSTVFAFPAPYGTKEIYEIKTNSDTNTASLLQRKYVQTEAVTVTGAAAATVASGIVIPADAIITNVLLLVDTQVVSANDNTLALGCEATDDLLAAADLTDDAAASLLAGIPVGTAATAVQSDGCTLTFTIGAGASGVTAGVLTVIAEYIVKE